MTVKFDQILGVMVLKDMRIIDLEEQLATTRDELARSQQAAQAADAEVSRLRTIVEDAGPIAAGP